MACWADAKGRGSFWKWPWFPNQTVNLPIPLADLREWYQGDLGGGLASRRASRTLSSKFRRLFPSDDKASSEKWQGITVWTDARLVQIARVMEGDGDDNAPDDDQWEALKPRARPISEFGEAAQRLIQAERTPGARVWEERAVVLLKVLCGLTQHDSQLVQYVEVERRRGLAAISWLWPGHRSAGT